jgi:hypothetical protein
MVRIPPFDDLKLVSLGEVMQTLPPEPLKSAKPPSVKAGVLNADEVLGLALMPDDPSPRLPSLGDAPRVESRAVRSDETLERLCMCLIADCGDMRRACEEAGIGQAFIHNWMRDDPEIGRAVNEARQIGWSNLESVAYERAVKGIKVPVYYQGEHVGDTTEYDNTVLMKMLQARVPAYATNERASASYNTTVNVAVMPRASTYEEWAAQRDSTLKTIEHSP